MTKKTLWQRITGANAERWTVESVERELGTLAERRAAVEQRLSELRGDRQRAYGTPEFEALALESAKLQAELETIIDFQRDFEAKLPALRWEQQLDQVRDYVAAANAAAADYRKAEAEILKIWDKVEQLHSALVAADTEYHQQRGFAERLQQKLKPNAPGAEHAELLANATDAELDDLSANAPSKTRNIRVMLGSARPHIGAAGF